MEKRLFMTHKSTDELKNELKTAANLRDYLSKNKENLLTTGLPEYLERLLSQKGLKKADVILFALQRSQSILEANELLDDQGLAILDTSRE